MQRKANSTQRQGFCALCWPETREQGSNLTSALAWAATTWCQHRGGPRHTPRKPSYVHQAVAELPQIATAWREPPLSRLIMCLVSGESHWAWWTFRGLSRTRGRRRRGGLSTQTWQLPRALFNCFSPQLTPRGTRIINLQLRRATPRSPEAAQLIKNVRGTLSAAGSDG